MEPFLISCPGCKIRLQITNPEFVGREFACPRCKTKLEVIEPTPEERAVAVGAEAAVGETGHVTGTFRLGPPKNQSQDATTAIGEFADIESILATGSSKPSGKWIDQPQMVANVSAEKRDADAVHRASQQRWTWLVFSIVGGSLAALMVTSLVIYVLSKKQEQQTAKGSPPVAVIETDKPPETEPPKNNGETPKDVEEGKAKVELPSGAKAEDDPPTKPNGDPPPDKPPPEVTPTPDKDAAAPGGFDSPKAGSETSPAPSGPVTEMTKKILEGSLRNKAPGGFLDAPVVDPTVMKPRPNLINVNQQFGVIVAGVRAEKLPLVDFLDLVSQLSGVPVSLDPAVISRGGIDPRAEVTVVVENQSLREIAETGLRPLGITLIALGGGLVATLPDSTQVPPLELTGIVLSPASGADFEKFIKLSVDSSRWGEPPQGAKLTIANGQIQFKGSPRVALGVKKLLDDIRAASSGQSTQLVADDLLNKPIEFKDSRLMRLEDVAAKLETIAGCEIRIDWVSLGAIGWNQETMVSVQAQNEPLREVLKKMCEPRAWAFRLIAPDVIEITTFLETYAGAETRVVSVKKQLDAGAAPEKIQAELAKAIAPAIPKSADPAIFVQVLREPPAAAIRGPASVQALAEAWLNNPAAAKPAEPTAPPATLPSATAGAS